MLLLFEFDKTQIPYSDSIDIPNLYMVCLATAGVCVFMRRLRSAHFYFDQNRRERGKTEKQIVFKTSNQKFNYIKNGKETT